MNATLKPKFRALERSEALALLERNHVGRIAFARGSRVEIVPINYVFASEWLYGRTTPGSRVERLGERWWPVAFQVDEVEGPFDWQSVVVHGGLYTVPPTGAEWEREAWDEGLSLLRGFIAETLGEKDPVPDRTTIFRIALQEVTGRGAVSR